MCLCVYICILCIHLLFFVVVVLLCCCVAVLCYLIWRLVSHVFLDELTEPRRQLFQAKRW